MTIVRRNPILILFGSNAVSYNIISALNDSGFNTISLLPSNAPSLNLFTKKIFQIKKSKYRYQSDDYLNDLIEFIKKQSVEKKILTFLTNDESIEFWIRNQTYLAPYCTIGTNNIQRFYHKSQLYQALDSLEVLYPETWKSTPDIPEAKFPVIVKPAFKDLNNQFFNTFNSKIIILKSKDDLYLLKQFKESELIFQEFLEFNSGDEFSWWGYRDTSGVIYSVVGKHLEKYPDRSGRITHTTLTENPKIKAIGDAIVKNMDYTGIADIQFILNSKDQQYYVIEMNPRLWCSHEILLMNKINFIRLFAEDYYNGRGKGLEYISGLRKKSSVEWYSVLYNIKHIFSDRFKMTEYFELKEDNSMFRIMITLFLVAKYVYYATNRKKIESGINTHGISAC